MAPRKPKLERSARDFMPEGGGWKALQEAAAHCEGCDLYKNATQTVFGAGRLDSRILLVGEQPGDQEDRRGKPFVGPAGRILDQALEEAGIDHHDVYVTNAVKHFKYEPRGKLRLHKKPDVREMNACRPWLEAELSVVHPRVLVCLGATAAQSIIGRDFRITRQRGEVIETPMCSQTLATYHPSAILRAPGEGARHEMRELLVSDLRIAARLAR